MKALINIIQLLIKTYFIELIAFLSIFHILERQWTYQTCVEFGFYQTSSTSSELFGPNFPLDFFLKQCSDIYGKR